MRIEQDALKSMYHIDATWYGPYDEDEDCVFNIGVGCPIAGRNCTGCGHNPIVSYHRIAKEFGKNSTSALTVRVE